MIDQFKNWSIPYNLPTANWQSNPSSMREDDRPKGWSFLLTEIGIRTHLNPNSPVDCLIGAVKKRIAIQRIFTHKKHRACPGKTVTLFLYVRAKNVLIFNDSVIARPSGRGDLLVKYANLKRSTRRLPRRFAARNDGVDDGWHLYPRKCIASICIRVSLQPFFCGGESPVGNAECKMQNDAISHVEAVGEGFPSRSALSIGYENSLESGVRS